MIYKKRIIDDLLKEKLETSGAILIQGPKWCGKTTTAEQFSKSRIYLDDPINEMQYIEMSKLNINYLLKGESPKLIDEWQLIPKLWDTIRFDVDHKDGFGHYILTGSSTPISSEEIHHSGAGRFSWLLMRPMSLYESNDSNGMVSLTNLFNNGVIYGENKLELNDLAYLICRGGWPRSLQSNKNMSLEHAFNYLDAIINAETVNIDGYKKNPEIIKKILRSYARNQGTQVSNETIINDVLNNDDLKLSAPTVTSYINLLKKMFVIEDMNAWNPNLRSKTSIRTSDTRYFIDPSIASASLGIGPDDLINDLNTFGFLFETLCIRDLRVFANSLHGEVYHYRDKTDLECDAVIHLRNANYGLVEIKLGGDDNIETACKNLKKLKEKIDTSKMKLPSFMMVLIGLGKFAYKREDGIYIVPIGCLKN